MGWKVELGIVAALIAGVVAFRKPISEALSSAGTTIGGSLGESISGGISSFVTGLAGGKPSQGQSPLDYALWGADQAFFGIPIPKIGGGDNSNTVQNNSALPPSSVGQNKNDQVVTQYNRDYSDLQNMREKAVVQSKTFMDTFNQVKLTQPSIGHAQQVRKTVAQTGLPTPKSNFDALRHQALKTGMSPAQAIAFASNAVRGR